MKAQDFAKRAYQFISRLERKIKKIKENEEYLQKLEFFQFFRKTVSNFFNLKPNNICRIYHIFVIKIVYKALIFI